MAVEKAHSRASFLARYWSGEGPLWPVFWLYGVLASFVLIAIFGYALAAGHLLAQQVLLPLFLGYTIWIVVSVWRCAPNTDQERYMHLARGLTVAWAINAVLVVTFLQLELLSAYMSGG